LKALKAHAYELKHVKSGARLLHLHSEDEENLLSFAFRTPPPNDTGLPHILEHSVLGGSKKYPVKEPFVELLKMSMATFINAMTYPDKTVYPVASNVKKDFWNLADVYFDACFHPNISEQTLKQEGHHLDFKDPENPASPLIVKGIVFNEMKGVYSSPDNLVSRYLLHHLFPDTPYGKDSGGDPEKIPELTFREFESFFKKFYHPANAYIFSFGDIPTEELCRFLDFRLEEFEKIPLDSAISPQPLWKEPFEKTYSYPIGEKDSEKAKSFIASAWLTGSGTEPVEVFQMEVLEQLLLGSAAAPLTKAVVDSHLGDDIISIGYHAGTLETFFGVGVRGSEPERKDAFLRVVEDALQVAVTENFSPSKVEAAFRQIENQYLEIPSMYPLWLMDRAYSTWIYDADPLVFLEAEKHIHNLKQRYEKEPRLFENLIRDKFLKNKHRFTLTLRPEQGLSQKREKVFESKMGEKKSRLSKKELENISIEARELALLQNTPNSPEGLRTLPGLSLTDIPKKPVEIPTSIMKTNSGVPLLCCDVFSNGVSYFNLNFDLTGLPDDLYDYLPLYCFCVSRMGAGDLDYVKMAERKEANSSGISASISFVPHVNKPEELVQRLVIRGKSLNRTFDEFLNIINDLVFTLDFSDLQRLGDVLKQKKSRHISALSSSGMVKAGLWAGRGANLAGYVNNRVSGVPQFWHIQRLVENFDAEKESMAEKLESIKKFLCNRNRLTAGVTAPEDLVKKAFGALNTISAGMAAEPLKKGVSLKFSGLSASREALVYPSDVSYCTWRVDAVSGSEPDGPLLKVLEKLLRYGRLWEEVRAKGGAYGAPVAYLEHAGAFRLASYRDPNIRSTLETFDTTFEYLKKVTWSETEIKHAVIATAKEGNTPVRPADSTGQALSRFLHGETAEYRAKKRERLLGATPRAVKEAAVRLFADGTPRVCVFAGKEKVEAENKSMVQPLSVEEVLRQVEK
ncbi:MAG: insulinase family protein, partial [Nitrospinota bacterium]